METSRGKLPLNKLQSCTESRGHYIPAFELDDPRAAEAGAGDAAQRDSKPLLLFRIAFGLDFLVVLISNRAQHLMEFFVLPFSNLTGGKIIHSHGFQ